MSAWVSMVAFELEMAKHSVEVTERYTEALRYDLAHGGPPPWEDDPEGLVWAMWVFDRFPPRWWWEDKRDSLDVTPRNAGPA